MEKEYKRPEEESKTWNVSQGYTHQLILKRIMNIEKYRELSIFGFANLEADLFVQNPNLRIEARIQALKRLIDSMKSLIYFSKFSLKEKEQNEKFDEHLKRLLKIEKNLYRLKSEIKSKGKINIQINEDLFDNIISELSGMIDNIIQNLNASGIIFRREEVKDYAKSITDM